MKAMAKKIVLFITAVTILAAVSLIVRFYIEAKRSKNMVAMTSIDLPCPDKPNCVSSKSPESDQVHFISPLALPASIAKPEDLLEVLTKAGLKIESHSDQKIKATHKSFWFGFIDDVDIHLDLPSQKAQIRSASRVGYSDFQANRRRVEQLRELLGKH